MDTWWLAALLGTASGTLIWRAERWPILAWIAYAPLGLALVWGSPAQAGLAGALAGALGMAASVSVPEFRALLPITVVPSALAWGLSSALGALLLARIGPAWLVLVLPASAVVGLVPLRLLGAPRWVANPLACTQERWLAVVHLARVGGDLTTTAVLAVGSAALVVALVGETASALVATTLCIAALGLGALGVRAAVRRVDAHPRVRIAAVVVDGPPPSDGPAGGLWPMESLDYRDVEATVRRYQPHVERAAAAGATVIALPEIAVNVDATSHDRWIEAVIGWARDLDVTLIAPLFDASVPVNTLAVIDGTGVRATYDKQHPARGLEPPARARCAPGPITVRTEEGDVPLSTVICVDLDYDDLVAPVRRAGGLLVAPANDWFGGFEARHHRTAVWAAVTTGVTTLRATGHGISAVLDGAGRVLAQRSSADGPVVLVVDAPIELRVP